jgi:hypothetical protein
MEEEEAEEEFYSFLEDMHPKEPTSLTEPGHFSPQELPKEDGDMEYLDEPARELSGEAISLLEEPRATASKEPSQQVPSSPQPASPQAPGSTASSMVSVLSWCFAVLVGGLETPFPKAAVHAGNFSESTVRCQESLGSSPESPKPWLVTFRSYHPWNGTRFLSSRARWSHQEDTSHMGS